MAFLRNAKYLLFFFILYIYIFNIFIITIIIYCSTYFEYYFNKKF